MGNARDRVTRQVHEMEQYAEGRQGKQLTPGQAEYVDMQSRYWAAMAETGGNREAAERISGVEWQGNLFEIEKKLEESGEWNDGLIQRARNINSRTR